MRRLAALLVTIAVVACAAWTSATSAATRKPGCRQVGSRTIVATPRARVFKWHTVVWGCLFKRGVAVRLTSNDGYGQDLTDFEFEENDKVPTDVKVAKLVVTPTGWVAWSWIATYDKLGDVPEIRRLRAGRSDIGLTAKPLDSGPERPSWARPKSSTERRRKPGEGVQASR